MENASKALIIAGEILIAILVLSIAITLIMNVQSVPESYEATITTQEVEKANSYFTKNDGREDLSPQEVVSVINYAKELNNKYDEGIVIRVNGVNYTSNSITNDDLINLIKNNLQEKYKCAVNYNNMSSTGMIKEVKFTKMTT